MSEQAVAPEARISVAQEAREAYRAMAALERAVELEHGLRGLVKLRASILNGCAYCVDLHTAAAAAAGESHRRLHQVATWIESPFFSERERAAFALTDAITRIADHQDLPQEVYEEALRHFSPQEYSQLVWAIIAINAWNRLAVVSRTRPADLAS